MASGQKTSMGRTSTGSAAMQGSLWSVHASDWAEILEGPDGWGIPLYRRLLEEAKIGPRSSVLDVGCGGGRFCRMAAELGATVAGIDAAEGLIAIAAQRVPEGDLRAGDMEDLPWADDSFDLVTALSSLQFAATPVEALREARRVTRPGGLVAAAVPGRPEEQELTPFMMALRPLLPPPPPGAQNGGPLALSQPGRLEALVREAGLNPQQTGEVDCPMEFADEETLLRGMLAAGPAVLATRTVRRRRGPSRRSPVARAVP